MKTKPRIKVFFVDDDPVYLQVLEKTMKDSLYYDVDVSTYPSAAECLDCMNKNKPDVVVLDYHLNSVDKEAINGVEALRRIKKHNPSVNVIMLSEQERIDVAINSMKYGAYDYIVKNENAFIRTQNAIRNVVEKVKLESVARQAKWLSYGVIGLIAVVMITVFIYSKLHPGFCGS